MSSKKNVEKKEIYGIKLRSRTVAKSVIISDTESEDEASTKIKLNSASKIVPTSSDEELDSIINEMATLNATYSKERNERPGNAKEQPPPKKMLNVSGEYQQLENVNQLMLSLKTITFLIRFEKKFYQLLMKIKDSHWKPMIIQEL